MENSEESYILPSAALPPFFEFWAPFLIIFLFFMVILFYRIGAGIPSILIVFTLLVLMIVSYFGLRKLKRTFCLITQESVVISTDNKKIQISMNQIQKIGIQALIHKSFGKYDVRPYLSILFKQGYENCIDSIEIKNAYGYFVKKKNLENYIGEKMDFYINMMFLKENDEGLISLLQKIPMFIKLRPLMNTSDKFEYDKVVAKYFQKESYDQSV